MLNPGQTFGDNKSSLNSCHGRIFVYFTGGGGVIGFMEVSWCFAFCFLTPPPLEYRREVDLNMGECFFFLKVLCS